MVSFGDDDCVANKGGISETSSYRPSCVLQRSFAVGFESFALVVDSGNNR